MTLLYAIITGLVGAAAVGGILYLLLLLVSAAFRTRRAIPPDERRACFAVLIPAHDEEPVIAATIESLQAQNYDPSRCEIIVIADNCSDRTAEIARGRGVRVLERRNLQERGKGYALDWALSRLLNEPRPADAFVIVDADTWVAPDFLTVMASHLALRREGRCALQGRYGVLNREEGWRAALMDCAFDLYNHVRPLGQEALGLSVGLKGNGMVFTRELLRETRWSGASVTEDIDFALDLLLQSGVRVAYVPGACVLAQMPVNARQATSQRERWEGGRFALVRRRALPLLAAALTRRDIRLLDAAVSLVLPPLAEMVALTLLWGILIGVGTADRLLPGAPLWWGGFSATVAGMIVYVLGGLRLSDAPREAYLALLKAPFYVVWKFALYGAKLLRPRKRRGDAPEWVRTERAPMAAAPGTADAVKTPGEN